MRGAAARACTLASALALLLASAGELRAEEFGGIGRYLGAGLNLGIDNFGSSALPVDADEGTGVSLWMGVRSSTSISGELGFDLGIFSGSNDETKATAYVGSISLNVKLYPLEGRIQPFALVGGGVGVAHLDLKSAEDSDEVGLTGRLGGGVDFHITETWSINATGAYAAQLGGIAALDHALVTVGVQAWFH